MTLGPGLFAVGDTKVPGDWRRSNPENAIYLPTTDSRNDRCNQQVVGIVAKSGSYVVTWTMASEESKPDQRVVISRMVEHEGKLLLFYNDCKHWVLFRRVPDELLRSEPARNSLVFWSL